MLQANYSFSGALSPLSKLIICAVMLRGRHRGLPVAIDRAVMLPFEFQPHQSEDETRVPSWEYGNGAEAGYSISDANENDDIEEGGRDSDHGPIGEGGLEEKLEGLETQAPGRSSWQPSANAERAEGESEIQRRASRLIDEELRELRRYDS